MVYEFFFELTFPRSLSIGEVGNYLKKKLAAADINYKAKGIKKGWFDVTGWNVSKSEIKDLKHSSFLSDDGLRATVNFLTEEEYYSDEKMDPLPSQLSPVINNFPAPPMNINISYGEGACKDQNIQYSMFNLRFISNLWRSNLRN